MPLPSIRPSLRAALHGDRQAISWLYDTFAPRLLRRLGQRFGGLPGLDAADLMQDTFVYLLNQDGRVLRRFLDGPQDDTEAAFSQFLWSAACGIASNRRRSVIRHPATSLEGQSSRAAIASGEEPTLARDVLERLARCLLRRGDRSYLYYQMRYRDGLTPAEVERATGWSRRSVYKLKQTLDQALERCLDEMGLPAP